MNLNGRVTVVTGGASGMGQATAEEFARCGARIAVFDRDESGAKRVAADLNSGAVGIGVDVADEDSVRRAMAAVDKAFGAVHVCVNAAGVPTPGTILSNGKALPLSEFRKVIEVNLIGLFDVARHCAERMVVNEPDSGGERGVIINVSSGAAWQGQRGQAAYAASKAGVIGLSLPLAKDLAAYGVRVMAVAPGLFDTHMVRDVPEKVRDSLVRFLLHPRRMGNPAEFAALALHIVENPYLNATTISLDGGARMI
jgi:3-hydroxyacyl-CoA dehydrogenase / 3-hydroxy-2-methylbutyryl-CoA dehydrogenase